MTKLQTQLTSCIVIFIFCFCAGNAPGKTNAKNLYKDVLIKDVPHVQQKNDFCGEACAEMYLQKLGINVRRMKFSTFRGLIRLKAEDATPVNLQVHSKISIRYREELVFYRCK